MFKLLPANYRSTRWVIVALLFGASMLNYVDRQTLSVLSPTLRKELGLTESDYSNIVSAFLLSYLVMYTVAGRLIDRFGVRAGGSVCMAWWSISTMLTSLVSGPWSLGGCRFLLGIGEPGIFPAGLKACGEWFPPRMRALATGIFSSGVSVGAVAAAPLVAFITLRWGWRPAFLLPGLIGLFWIPLWWSIYRVPSVHPAVTPEERKMLGDDKPAGPPKRWRELLTRRNVWGLVLPRLASDPVWYFYLFWLPDYFQRVRHLSLAQIGIFGWIPFVFADLGNVGGGALSDWLIRRGWTAARARFALLAGVGVLAPCGAAVGLMTTTGGAIAVTCLIAFLCQVWSTNIATLASDLSDRNETATVLGMMGAAGSLGGILFAQLLAFSIASWGYASAFILASVLHPAAVIALFLLLRPFLARPIAKANFNMIPPKKNLIQAFTLVELLVSISIIGIILSLGMVSLRGISSDSSISTGGARLAGLLEAARENAIVQHAPTAIIMLTANDGAAARTFTALQFLPATTGTAASWKQISKWDAFPTGAVARLSGGLSAATAGFPLAFVNSPDMNPKMPSLTYSGKAYAPRIDYGYVVFLPDGSLYQSTTPVLVQVVSGFGSPTGPIFTGSDNYLQIVINDATGRAKTIRP